MRDRRILVGGIILAAVVLLLVGVSLRGRGNTTTPPPSEIRFTDAVTGQTLNDIVGEDSSLAGDTGERPSVTIGGIDALYNNLTDDQASNTQTIINNFLMARSGLASVRAGIQNDVVTIKGNTVNFTLVVQRPQATYNVTVSTTSALQSIPNVAIEQVEP